VVEAPQPEDLVATVVPLVEARSQRAWLVGGWVRDRLLGRETHDIDLVVPTGAIAIARQVADLLGGAFVLLDDARDTARVVVGPSHAPTYLDFSGLRAATIEEDLLGRDFTVNAMAVDAAEALQPQPHVIDPAGGRRDLAEGVLRAVSPEAFREDPLRMLRAVRLSAALGFEIESETMLWIRRNAELLDAVSRERVRDELAQILSLPEAERSLRQLDNLGLLERVVPELGALRHVEARDGGTVNALSETLRGVGITQALIVWLQGEAWELPAAIGEALVGAIGAYRARLAEYLMAPLPGGRARATMLMLAALLHRVGKGATEHGRAAPGGRLLGHEVLGASMAATVARRLCFSSAEAVRVRLAVRSYLRPRQMAHEPEQVPERRAIYRFFRDAEPAGIEAILLSLTSELAVYDGAPALGEWQRLLLVDAALLEAYFERRREVIEPVPVVSGHDLIESLGLVPGPHVGVLLDGIREAQAAGEVRTREEALAFARHLLEREGLR